MPSEKVAGRSVPVLSPKSWNRGVRPVPLFRAKELERCEKSLPFSAQIVSTAITAPPEIKKHKQKGSRSKNFALFAVSILCIKKLNNFGRKVKGLRVSSSTG